MILNIEPFEWNSPYRPVVFRYNFQSSTFASINNVGGKAEFVCAAVPSGVPLVAGDRVYAQGAYHTVVSVAMTEILTDTDYTGTASGDILFVRLPEIKLYKGYNTGETYDADLPLTLIATFTPRVSPDVDIYIDVAEYLKRIFPSPNIKITDGTDFAMFNRFRLQFIDDAGDLVYSDNYHVLNSALKSLEINEYYADTGRALNSAQVPYLPNCGLDIVSFLSEGRVLNIIEPSDSIIEPAP